MAEPHELMITPEVAELTRTPVQTLRKWRMVGEGPPGFRLGRKLVYRRCDVEAWLEAQRHADAG